MVHRYNLLSKPLYRNHKRSCFIQGLSMEPLTGLNFFLSSSLDVSGKVIHSSGTHAELSNIVLSDNWFSYSTIIPIYICAWAQIIIIILIFSLSTDLYNNISNIGIIAINNQPQYRTLIFIPTCDGALAPGYGSPPASRQPGPGSAGVRSWHPGRRQRPCHRALCLRGCPYCMFRHNEHL